MIDFVVEVFFFLAGFYAFFKNAQQLGFQNKNHQKSYNESVHNKETTYVFICQVGGTQSLKNGIMVKTRCELYYVSDHYAKEFKLYYIQNNFD